MKTPDTAPAYPLRWILGLGVVSLVVHLSYFAAGVKFDRASLDGIMHFLDAEMLRTQLFESILYLHIQPPLMNLVTGLVLKITPESTLIFHILFLVLGNALFLSVFLLQLRLGVSRSVAAVLASVFLASPAFILFEYFLLYTLPCAAFLAMAALCLVDYLQTRRVGWLVGFVLMVFLLCGTRSAFHLGYFVLAIGLILALDRAHWRRIAAVALVPFVLLFGFYFKNWVIFGEFTACTFVEKNLWIMTAGNINWDEKVQMVEQGELSEFALINRWASLDAYPDQYKEVPERFADIPVLSETHKRNGEVNYNHYGNIAICNIYGEDARAVLRAQPQAYVYAMALSWYRYFLPSHSVPVSPPNRAIMGPALRFYDTVVFGTLPVDLSGWSVLVKRGGHPPAVFLLVGLPLVFFYGAYRFLRGRGLTLPQRVLLGFMLFNIAMIAVMGCAFDFHETARYRFNTDGYSIVLLGMLITAVGQHLRRVRE